MVSTDLKHIRVSVFLLATLIAGLVAMALLALGKMSPVSGFFLFSGYILMVSHWLLLVWLVSDLFRGAGGIVFARGSLAAFPVFLALALLAVAMRRVPSAAVPAVLGLASVPVAETVCALMYGIGGLVGPLKGAVDE